MTSLSFILTTQSPITIICMLKFILLQRACLHGRVSKLIIH